MKIINKIKSVFKKDDDIEKALLKIISRQAFKIKYLEYEIEDLKNNYKKY